MNKKPAGTLDLEPTWESLLPTLLGLYIKFHNPKTGEESKHLKTVESQLRLMAAGATLYRQRQKEIYARIIMFDGVTTTIGEFISANSQDGECNLPVEDLEMILDMRPGERITTGGGAAGETIITRPEN